MSALRLASLSSSGHGPRQPSRVIVSLIAAIVGRCAKLLPMDRIVVVGASLAGLRACESLRTAGYTGTITLIGAERHLPYDRPPLSKALLKGDWEPERIQLRKPDDFAGLGLDLRLGITATALDASRRSLTLATGEVVVGDGVIIATGSAPRPLPNQPDLDGVTMLRTLDDSLDLRRRLADRTAGGRDRRWVHRSRSCRDRGPDRLRSHGAGGSTGSADARPRCGDGRSRGQGARPPRRARALRRASRRDRR